MYLAFALTEKERDGIQIELSSSDDTNTDSQIREELKKHLDRKEFALALCEPDPIGSERDTQYARIPLLWRQPHWMLRSRGLEPASRASIIFCYPEDTTSGNYVRSLKSAGLLNSDAVFKKMVDYQVGILDDPRSAFVTFTPWHLVHSELEATDLFSGPDRDVTALIVPRHSYGTRIDAGRLKDDISRNLKSILHALALTHGNEDKVANLVSKHSAFIEPLLRPAAYHLPRSLAEYVRLGCYFPYGVVASALYGELLRISADNFERASIRALAGAGQDLSRLLGTGRDWSELAFSERMSVWATGGGNGHRGLAQRISHSPAEEVIPILTGTAVLLTNGGMPISLDSLNKKGRHLLCSEFQGRLCMARFNQRPGSSEDTHQICFACTAGGIAMSVLRTAASELAKEFKRSVPFRVCGREQTEQLPLCWEDIEDLIKIFCDERRPFDHDTPCEVTLCHDSKHGRCRINIYWRGETTPGNGTNSAHNRIRQWAENHIKAHRNVMFAGFWKNHRFHNALKEKEKEHYMQHECTFKCEHGFEFGYIAVFQYGNTER